MITAEAHFKDRFGREPDNSRLDQSYLAWARCIQRAALVRAVEIVAKVDQTPPIMPSEVIARASRAIIEEIERI